MQSLFRFLLAALLPLAGSSLASAQRPPKDALEGAVDQALLFLRLLQEKDGSWMVHGQKHIGVSALATTAFLAAGHVPGEGPYGDVVARGIGWLLKQQDERGVFSSEPGLEMYHHGITTLLLSQLTGMTDSRTAGPLRSQLEKAVRVILKAQVKSGPHSGGWRYQVTSVDADLSVTSWQVMALRGARNVGCDVPAEAMQKALRFVAACRDPATGGYCYTAGYSPSPACTGTALLILELAGKNFHRSRDAIQAGSFLLKNALPQDDSHFHYGVYYTAQGMFQLGSNYWNAYRPTLHKLLLSRQNRNGSWIGPDSYGPVYATSMAVLALTVEYRLLPIYQREEEAPK
jgi:hypothetical protein